MRSEKKGPPKRAFYTVRYILASKWPVNGISFFILGIVVFLGKAIAAATTVTILLMGQRRTSNIVFHKLHLLSLY